MKPSLAPNDLDLDGMLKRLHLPTIRRLYRQLETRAEAEEMSYADYLTLLIAEEIAHRAETRIQRAVRKQSFPSSAPSRISTSPSRVPSGANSSAASSALNSSPRDTTLSSLVQPAEEKPDSQSRSPTAPSRTASRHASPPQPHSSKNSPTPHAPAA